MMKLALMRTATGKEDPELPLLQRIVSLELPALGPPGWRNGRGHCIAVLAVPSETLSLSPGSVGAGRDVEVHGTTHHWPIASSGLGRVWPGGISLSHRALATPVAGRAQCTLSRSAGAQCFLRHIGVTGFQVGCALC
jgi:hypothetical protein